jgi:hypothetical protein
MSLREPEQSRSQRAARSPAKLTETKQQREQRLRNTRAEKRQLRQRLVEDNDAVLTFKEWCALNSLSERQGRRILKSGNGPTITALSDRRIGISRKHNIEWQVRRARSNAMRNHTDTEDMRERVAAIERRR